MAESMYELDGVKWERVKVLGRGSFGEALLVKRVDKPDALGVCKRVVLSGMKPEERKEAINEVNVLKRLKHPNIVEYYGSFEKNDVLHIFMEYANSGDIDGLIKEHVKAKPGQHIDETLVASLVVQMACAIKYLHQRHILHRDLKAQNVFLSRRRPDGPLIVKLGDFGISTVLRNTHAMAKTVCGTPYYFSPELCLNRPYNSKTDVWSLGCIMYELVALKHVFDAQNMKALVARILKGTYTPIPSQYSPELANLIDMMLQQKTERRYDIDGVLKSPWMKRQLTALCSNDLMRTITANIAVVQAVQRVAASSDGAAPRPSIVGPRGGPEGPQQGKPTRLVPLDPVTAKAEQARLRREAVEHAEQERRLRLEEERLKRNQRIEARGATREQDARRRQKLGDMDEIRTRMELQTYEEQQAYVEKGWNEVQRVAEKQDSRERQAKQRDDHLALLRQQMEEIESKMKNRRSSEVAASPPQGVARTPPIADRAQQLWEEEKRKIEAARSSAAAEQQQSLAAEAAWKKQQQRIEAAREEEQRQQQMQKQRDHAFDEAETPPWLRDDFKGAGDDAEFDRVMACVQDVQRMALPSINGPSRAPASLPFEEKALPANDVSRMEQMVKFTLDGKTLHLNNVKPTDPIARRAEALRSFLTEALGGSQAFEKLFAELDYIQGCDADDDAADRMLLELEASYGPRGKYVDLMVQYLVCVAMHNLK